MEKAEVESLRNAYIDILANQCLEEMAAYKKWIEEEWVGKRNLDPTLAPEFQFLGVLVFK